ncbi:MAG: NAD-binding protein, partial [Robiginitomaculum sp.]|nr:NAD-binding protein [Robiginitomaculum sp.]
AGHAKAAVITIDHVSSASQVVGALRKNYPVLPIYVRARDRQHMRSLEESGASAVVSEAAESSLQLGSIVLQSLNVSVDEIASLIDDYREDDYAKLEEIISGK